VKRVYEPFEEQDGERYLVDRLWPRGIKKEEARIAGWLRELAPSDELRRFFAHDSSRWEEFRKRYRQELSRPEVAPLLEELRRKAHRGTVTLLYAARDEERNNALVLKEFLEEEGTVTA
jgi:uncharacterized protein YeaO (DUF488 family)